FLPPAERRLYVVGGKGGVGKSTAAAALATWRAARGGGRVLLLSVDPAGSLAEVLAQPVGISPTAVEGAPGLDAQQLDAEAVWSEFRGRYRTEAETLFESLVSGGPGAGSDREVVERLIDLAPPGIDELMAVMEVIDLLDAREYDALVIDTAPTGHFLRLLQLPALALEWTHALLRLLLKYREVTGLGALAERTLGLARDLRALRALLGDPARTWFLAVALPEALSVPETGRLLARLPELGLRPGALLVNRALSPGGTLLEGGTERVAELVRLAGALPSAAAPALDPAPAGAAALLDFARSWKRIST
ncbi:MAG TPA: ArsA family ATPase, partial [Longimicrobiaceae bacterium]|nr:ArsA family ATPase [Longimicrobiaceae bacterium]